VKPLPLLAAATLMVVTLVAAACATPTATSAPAQETITASVLVEAAASSPQWFRNVEVAKGTDGYELLMAATGGQVEAEWHPEFRSHFVQSVLSVAPEGSEFWAVFMWNETAAAWEPLPVGADLFSVKQGHIMGWAIVEYSPDSVTPQAKP
jgi:hypothetical protein